MRRGKRQGAVTDHYLKRAVSAAEGYAMLGMIEEAAAALDDLGPKLATHPAVLAVRVQIFMASEDWAAAVEIAKRLVEFVPRDPQHWILLANLMRRTESVKAAEEVLLDALEHHPTVAMRCRSNGDWFDAAILQSHHLLKREPSGGVFCGEFAGSACRDDAATGRFAIRGRVEDAEYVSPGVDDRSAGEEGAGG